MDAINKCLCCGSTSSLKRCSGCREAFFCNQDCQKQAWPVHKATCKRAKVSASSSPASAHNATTTTSCLGCGTATSLRDLKCGGCRQVSFCSVACKERAWPTHEAACKQVYVMRSGGGGQRRCGLCGKKKKLIKTECCNSWICDDEDKYVLMSFSHVSCSRNHRRYTMCGLHMTERHGSDVSWKDCEKCRACHVKDSNDYNWRATNEYNISPLENPPPFRPLPCGVCGQEIDVHRGDGFSTCFKAGTQQTLCLQCAA